MSNTINTRLEERAIELASQLDEAQLEHVTDLIDSNDLEALWHYTKLIWEELNHD